MLYLTLRVPGKPILKGCLASNSQGLGFAGHFKVMLPGFIQAAV